MGFETIWGDLNVGNPQPKEEISAEEKPKPATPAPVDTGTEEEIEVVTPAATITKAGDAEETAEEGTQTESEEEYEYTDDDISKAYSMLSEEGVLEIGEDDEFEGTTTGLADAVAATVQNKLKKEIEAIPPVVQEFYAHVQEGKDVSSFVASKTDLLWEEYDISEEPNQEATLRAFYKTQEMSEEDIDEEIADVKEAGKLEKKAQTAKSSLSKLQTKSNTAKATAREEADKTASAERQTEITRIQNDIDEMDELAGFKLDKTRKAQFKDYLFNVNPRTGKTQMQDNMQDEKRRLTIGFLDFVEYTKADLSKEEATRLTKTRKKKLVQFTDKNVKNRNNSASVTTRKDEKKGNLVIPGIFGAQTIEIED
jgi:hypothetical protein